MKSDQETGIRIKLGTMFYRNGQMVDHTTGRIAYSSPRTKWMYHTAAHNAVVVDGRRSRAVLPLHGEPGDYWRFTGHGVRWLAKQHGFEVTHLEPLGNWRMCLWQIRAAEAWRRFGGVAASVPAWRRWAGRVRLLGVSTFCRVCFLAAFAGGHKPSRAGGTFIGWSCVLRKR